jgi:hypothetical protein
MTIIDHNKNIWTLSSTNSIRKKLS